MEKPALLIKLGGSIITDKQKPYVARLEHLRALSQILVRIHQPLIIAHGSGSFGHTSAAEYGGGHGYKDKWGVAKVSRDAMAINSIVMDSLLDAKIPAISLRPASLTIADTGELSEAFFTPVKLALSQGLVPVLYGDVIWDKAWQSTIFSGETILSYVAEYLIRSDVPVEQVIELCDTDGVLDSNKKTIPEIMPENWHKILSVFFASKTKDVTGGMQHKVEEALRLAKKGIMTRIINGNNVKEVEAVLLRNIALGTLIHT